MESKVQSSSGVSKRRAFSVRMFLADGTPDGVRIVEKSNWSGRGIMCARAQFATVRVRSEFDRAGVYVLVGPDTAAPDRMRIYVGEGDVVRDRIEDHVRKKEFWTHLVLFISKDETLNKAHVQYLESRLVAIAAQARRAALENGNTPRLPNLAEPDVADVEAFLDDMLLIYPLLGVFAFDLVNATPDAGPLLRLEGKGIHGEGRDTPEGFVVYKGATLVADSAAAPSIHGYLVELRKELLERGVVVASKSGYTLAQNYAFNSPSTAAGVLLGRSANGRIEWKDAQGRTLKELQEMALSQPVAEAAGE